MLDESIHSVHSWFYLLPLTSVNLLYYYYSRQNPGIHVSHKILFSKGNMVNKLIWSGGMAGVSRKEEQNVLKLDTYCK